MMIQQLTRDAGGHELQFATNHLGHFDLTTRLRPALAAADGARVVMVSSSGHLFGPVVFRRRRLPLPQFDPVSAYAQSKTAEILFAAGATAKVGSRRHCGQRSQSRRHRDRSAAACRLALATPVEKQKNVEQGASTSIFAAVSPLLEGIGGRYFNDNIEAASVLERPEDPDVLVTTVAGYALDPEAADRLLALSADFLG
jgi:NAD(P)-dependent dehydrogenase (short-subunit alcohol dehydrogenase family)